MSADWKIGNEFAPYHPSASHVDPSYRDGWNHCYEQAQALIAADRQARQAPEGDRDRLQFLLDAALAERDLLLKERDEALARASDPGRAFSVGFKAGVSQALASAAPQIDDDNAPTVECWNGEKKVTIYPTTVLRSWGKNIDTEMSDEPRTLKSVDDAMRWLYAAPDALDARRMKLIGYTTPYDVEFPFSYAALGPATPERCIPVFAALASEPPQEKPQEPWEETARQYARNADYYRGLLDQCAKRIGVPAYTADDQGVHTEALRAKIPECVEALCALRDATQAWVEFLYDVRAYLNFSNPIEGDRLRLGRRAVSLIAALASEPHKER